MKTRGDANQLSKENELAKTTSPSVVVAEPSQKNDIPGTPIVPRNQLTGWPLMTIAMYTWNFDATLAEPVLGGRKCHEMCQPLYGFSQLMLALEKNGNLTFKVPPKFFTLHKYDPISADNFGLSDAVQGYHLVFQGKGIAVCIKEKTGSYSKEQELLIMDDEDGKKLLEYFRKLSASQPSFSKGSENYFMLTEEDSPAQFTIHKETIMKSDDLVLVGGNVCMDLGQVLHMAGVSDELRAALAAHFAVEEYRVNFEHMAQVPTEENVDGEKVAQIIEYLSRIDGDKVKGDHELVRVLQVIKDALQPNDNDKNAAVSAGELMESLQKMAEIHKKGSGSQLFSKSSSPLCSSIYAAVKQEGDAKPTQMQFLTKLCDVIRSVSEKYPLEQKKELKTW